MHALGLHGVSVVFSMIAMSNQLFPLHNTRKKESSKKRGLGKMGLWFCKADILDSRR
jgi:hypothetical protein